MISKSELKAELEAANSTIEYLRAKLCKDGHEWVKVGEKTVFSRSSIDMHPIFVCTRCLKRKVGW